MNKHNAPRLRGLVAVRADASEAKGIIDEFNRTFADFRKANDERIENLAKGKADAAVNERVETLNAALTDLQAQIADVTAKAAAMQIGVGEGANEAVKAAAAFSVERGHPVSVEEYQSYAKALNTYMRKGNATPSDVRAAMQVGSDPDGGYTVTPDMSGRIVTKVFETSPMRQVADVQTIGTDAYEGFNDLDEASSGWVGEQTERTETDTPQLGKWSIPVHEMYAMPKTTQKLLDDSSWNIEAWLSGKVSDKFMREENYGFVLGDGVLKPRGLWTYTTAATADASRAWGSFEHINTGASGAFDTAPAGGDKLIDLVFALKAQHRINANFMMARSTVAAVRKLKDGDGNYLWQPNFEARQGGLLLGYPIVEAEDVPVIAANSLSIAFGDFREAYTIVDRIGIRVLRDPFTTKGFVKFYTTRRVGGGAIHFEAVKFMRFGT